VWRRIRIALLLTVLVIAAGVTWLDRQRTTGWRHTVWVGAFAFNADGSDAGTAYLGALRDADLVPIAAFIAREARRHGVTLDEPVRIAWYPAPASPPPQLADGAGIGARIAWSLELRLYRWRAVHAIARARPQVVLFMLYHDPALAPALPESHGLQRGLVGQVQLYAARAQAAQNDVVTAHELLHTFGATDKYSAADGAPLYPQGYAEPALQPRWPQRYAEIMAGRVAVAPGRQRMPDSLDEVLVGDATAREIGWSAAQ
jgi:hypothetical protein